MKELIRCVQIKQHKPVNSWIIPEAQLKIFLQKEQLPFDIATDINNLTENDIKLTEEYADYYIFKRISTPQENK